MPFAWFLPDLHAFMVELWCGVAAIALLIAGVALLGANPSWLVEKIPVVGGFVASIRRGAGFVLLGLAILSGSFGAGYFMRGSLERERALEAKIERKFLREQVEITFAVCTKHMLELADPLHCPQCAAEAAVGG